MRIAIVGTELCPVDASGGGLEQVLRRWAASLAAHHDVVVISHRRRGPRSDAGGTASDAPDTITIDGSADLAGALARLQPDVVSLHNRPQWASRVPLGAASAVTFHNYPSGWKVPCRLVPATRRWAAGSALSAVSGALATAAARWLAVPAPPAGPVPLGGRAQPGGPVPPEVLVPEVTVVPPSIDPAYLEDGWWRPEPVVLSPNRLLAKKGVRELLAVAGDGRFGGVTFAFADLISPWSRPTAEHRALRAAVGGVPNAVLFPPAHDPRELAERYRRSAVVACPVQEEEGLGLVALEAQACGVPLVTTDLGGLREATLPPNACVRPADPDALAEALAAALSRAGVAVPGAERRGAAALGPAGGAARRLVAARHSAEASAAAFERWLESAVGAGRSHPPMGDGSFRSRR